MKQQITTWIIIGMALFTFISCEKSDDPVTNIPNELNGNWVNPVVNDSIWTFDRADQLKDNDYGFSMQSNQVFVERKNAGWCGTPPITYADFEGYWTQNDSLIDITVDFWGGWSYYQWKILHLDENNLKIIRKSETHEFEE